LGTKIVPFWDAGQIAEGRSFLDRALALRRLAEL